MDAFRQTIAYPDFTFRFRRLPFPTLLQARLLTELQQYMQRKGLEEPRMRMPARPPRLSEREDEELEWISRCLYQNPRVD